MSNFIKQKEDVALTINGEAPGGEQMELGEDVLLYFKLAAFEQPVLTRLRATPPANLAGEIASKPGFIFLGEPEDVRKELHSQIDKLFDALKAYRIKRDSEKELAK